MPQKITVLRGPQAVVAQLVHQLRACLEVWKASTRPSWELRRSLAGVPLETDVVEFYLPHVEDRKLSDHRWLLPVGFSFRGRGNSVYAQVGAIEFLFSVKPDPER